MIKSGSSDGIKMGYQRGCTSRVNRCSSSTIHFAKTVWSAKFILQSLSRLNKVHLYLNSPLQNKFCTPRAKRQNKFCTPRAKRQNKFCTPRAKRQNKFCTKNLYFIQSGNAISMF
ncbi:hypothetical protein BGS_1050 [Beggiatoa sp. SS]|nr:hypothetical protein BGS_1050 [Beggiatoa sp. SS]